MSTPVGDWIRRRWPDNPGATHYLGEGDDPGCCAGPHARCTYEAGWREGLASLAADFGARSMAGVGWDKNSSTAWGDAAEAARQRAEGGPVPANEPAPVSREGHESPGDPDAIQAAGGADAIAPAVWAAAVVLHEAGCILPGCQHTEHDVGQQDHDLAADMVLAAAPHVAAAKRSALSQVPAESCCPAEVTTFLGLKLECESDPHRSGMHLDVDQGIWWTHYDESAADPVAAERARLYAELGNDHFVTFSRDRFTVEHSVECKLSGHMHECAIHAVVAALADGGMDPEMLGRWLITGISEGLPGLERADG